MLFPELEPDGVVPAGLVYREEFLSTEEERELLRWIDGQEWSEEMLRRRQFHGGSRDPRGISELPEILADLAQRLYDARVIRWASDRVLINEYFPGQGIGAHIDEHPRSDAEVAMVSLGDSYPMQFVHLKSGAVYEHWLSRRSVCVISGESRTDWTHEIVKRRSDYVAGGGKKLRGRRVSVTLRTST